MISETLFEKLNNLSAKRESRLHIANWVLSRPEVFPELLELCFAVNDDISYKACCILEFVCLERLELLFPYLDSYFENLPKIYKNQALRPIAKICELLAEQYYRAENTELKEALKKSHRKTMTSCCFDWLITNQKVACEVYAMSALYQLGKETDWVHTELETIIQANLHQRSAGYTSRGKKVLTQIIKFRHK